jgi:hypothetical protein
MDVGPAMRAIRLRPNQQRSITVSHRVQSIELGRKALAGVAAPGPPDCGRAIDPLQRYFETNKPPRGHAISGLPIAIEQGLR